MRVPARGALLGIGVTPDETGIHVTRRVDFVR